MLFFASNRSGTLGGLDICAAVALWHPWHPSTLGTLGTPGTLGTFVYADAKTLRLGISIFNVLIL